MAKILGHLKKTLREILPVFVFFYLMINILGTTRAMALKEYGINVESSAAALVGALVVAKAIFLTGRLPFLNLYPKRPLIWNVVLKTLVFSLIVTLFLVIEEMIHIGRRYGSFSAGYGHFGSDVIWPAFWAREIWFTILLFFYCASAELARVVGVDRIKKILFGL